MTVSSKTGSLIFTFINHSLFIELWSAWKGLASICLKDTWCPLSITFNMYMYVKQPANAIREPR